MGRTAELVPWYTQGGGPAVGEEAWGSPPARSPRSCGRVPAAVLWMLKGRSRNAAVCVPGQGRGALLRVLCVSPLEKRFAEPEPHPERGAAPGLPGAGVVALLCPAEGMGWERGFPRPCWGMGRGDAYWAAGPETPCLPAKRGMAVGAGLRGDGEGSGCCRGAAPKPGWLLGLALRSHPMGAAGLACGGEAGSPVPALTPLHY